jgi:cation diffusion facilitator family transporter
MQASTRQQQDKNSNFNLQFWIAIVSILLLVLKFLAYHLTHSVSVLTDALESIVNVAAALIGLYSLYISAKPKDFNHPYGHGKAEYISAAIEGTLVLAAGTLVIYKSIKSLLAPVSLTSIDVGIYLIGATAVINWLFGYFTLKQGKRNASVALAASGRHLQTDSYSTFAIIAGLILIAATGYHWIDPIAAIIFGLFIIYTGSKIIRQSLAGIMDEADMSLLKKMVEVLNKNRHDNWVDLHNLRVIKYGNILHVDCHLTVPWYLNVKQAHDEVDELDSLIRKDFGDALELFVHSDGCQYYQCHICDKKACHVRQHPFRELIIWTVDNVLQDKKHELQDAQLQTYKL